VSVSGYLIGSQEANQAPLPPPAELAWWYQYYFATERGRAGYDKYRRQFAKLVWQTASPKWNFDDSTFDRSAAAFDNPDHVSIVIHNYRWRLGLAPGEPQYDELETRLAKSPTITVPTITLEGDANGAPHPDPGAYATKFSGKYVHRTIRGGVGHNLPQEAPPSLRRRCHGGRRLCLMNSSDRSGSKWCPSIRRVVYGTNVSPGRVAITHATWDRLCRPSRERQRPGVCPETRTHSMASAHPTRTGRDVPKSPGASAPTRQLEVTYPSAAARPIACCEQARCRGRQSLFRGVPNARAEPLQLGVGCRPPLERTAGTLES
jgi:hypothetical protein